MSASDPHRCFYCGGSDTLQELKRLGPAGAAVCLPCVTDPRHPEREAAAQAVYEEAQHMRAVVTRERGGVVEVSPTVTTIRFGG
jgi:hypothetical protein